MTSFTSSSWLGEAVLHLLVSLAPLPGILSQERKLTLPSWKSRPLIATLVICQSVVLKQAASTAQASCNFLWALDGERTLPQSPHRPRCKQTAGRQKLLEIQEKIEAKE